MDANQTTGEGEPSPNYRLEHDITSASGERLVPRYPTNWAGNHSADSIALKTAHAIEDLFAQHHEGGRTQRLAKMQVLIREAMAGSK